MCLIKFRFFFHEFWTIENLLTTNVLDYKRDVQCTTGWLYTHRSMVYGTVNWSKIEIVLYTLFVLSRLTTLNHAVLVHITWVNLEDYGTKVGSVRYSPVNLGGRDSTKNVYSTILSLLQSTVEWSVPHCFELCAVFVWVYSSSLPRLECKTKWTLPTFF